MPYRLALSTIDERQKAEDLARRLLEERLVACVNIVGPLTSLYRWHEAVACEEEYLLIMKTMAHRQASLIERVRELHPYDVPELIVVPIETGMLSYLQWMAASV